MWSVLGKGTLFFQACQESLDLKAAKETCRHYKTLTDHIEPQQNVGRAFYNSQQGLLCKKQEDLVQNLKRVCSFFFNLAFYKIKFQFKSQSI